MQPNDAADVVVCCRQSQTELRQSIDSLAEGVVAASDF